MTSNDYVVFAGASKTDVQPIASAPTLDEGKRIAVDYAAKNKCKFAEVTYMPENNVDITELRWFKFFK